jgi:hypothetical protein
MARHKRTVVAQGAWLVFEDECGQGLRPPIAVKSGQRPRLILLNPVESVWSVLKRSLANLARRDIAQLTALAKARLRRMQYRHGLIEGFLAGTRLDLTPVGNPRN